MTIPSDAAHQRAAHSTTFDPAGQAALLLTESLIHQLLARSALSASDAVELVQCAIDSQFDIEGEKEGVSLMATSPVLGLLAQIKSTLEIDTSAQ